MKVKKLMDSFNFAIEGIINSVRTQRNMKIHMVAAIIVFIMCFVYDVSKIELMILTICITMVMAAELINSAIESYIDAHTNFYHPLAKIAKNAAAGAVLVTAINSVFVGYIIFWKKLRDVSFVVINKIKFTSPYMLFLVLVIVLIATIIVKAIFGEGTALKGGMPSGHSTIAFSIATLISLTNERPLTIVLAYSLALIVAQSRVDSHIHSIWEVIVGAIFGTGLTIIIFRIFS